MPRFYCPMPVIVGTDLDLAPNAARHVQVLRLQPGASITLFDGLGGEYEASITSMTRQGVSVTIQSHCAIEREAAMAVHLAMGVPANDRMDWLIEKATELGVASIQPLMTERGVLRLGDERATKKQAHWQAIAIAACEQSKRNTVPRIAPIQDLPTWLAQLTTVPAANACRLLLSFRADAAAWSHASAQALSLADTPPSVWVLSGAEGGLTAKEETLALRAGFQATSLGARVLRAETAALAALAALVVAA